MTARYIVTKVRPDNGWRQWVERKYINNKGEAEDLYIIKDNDRPVNDIVPIVRQFVNSEAFHEWFYKHGAYPYEEIIPK